MTITIPLKHYVNLKPLCKIARSAVCGCSTIPLSFPLDCLLPHFYPLLCSFNCYSMAIGQRKSLAEEKINSTSSPISMIHLNLAGRVLPSNENHGIT